MLNSNQVANFRSNYNKQYEQAIYPNLNNIIQYVKQRVSLINWNQVNDHFKPLIIDLQHYYQQNKNQFKNELQNTAQLNYEANLKQYQQILQRYTLNSSLPKPIEPQLQVIGNDVILSVAISTYVNSNSDIINNFFNNNEFTFNLINKDLINDIIDINPFKLLINLMQGKSIQHYVENQIKDIDEISDYIHAHNQNSNRYLDESNISSIIQHIINIEKVAIPNLILDLFSLMQNNGYQWYYFNFLNTDVLQIQAYLGKISLNANNYEQYANIFSLDQPYRQMVGGWTKDALLEAIFKSGLMVENKTFKNTHNLRVEGPNVIMDRVKINIREVPLTSAAIHEINKLSKEMFEFDELFYFKNGQIYIIIDKYFTLTKYLDDERPIFNAVMTDYDLADIYANPQHYLFTSIKTYTYKAKNRNKAQLIAYRLTHCLPYRSISQNKEGCIKFNKNSSHNFIDEIYRKIYGTIYTINWPEFCQSGRVQIIYPQRLQKIITTYFNPGYDIKITSYQQFCQLVLQQLPSIQQYMQNLASPEEWFQFIRSRYNQRIIQPAKRTMQLPIDQLMSKMRLE